MSDRNQVGFLCCTFCARFRCKAQLQIESGAFFPALKLANDPLLGASSQAPPRKRPTALGCPCWPVHFPSPPCAESSRPAVEERLGGASCGGPRRSGWILQIFRIPFCLSFRHLKDHVEDATLMDQVLALGFPTPGLIENSS